MGHYWQHGQPERGNGCHCIASLAASERDSDLGQQNPCLPLRHLPITSRLLARPVAQLRSLIPVLFWAIPLTSLIAIAVGIDPSQ